MALLLCRQRARVPYCHEKLNINIWSGQELSYIIYNYPLLCMRDFMSERLMDWIENELKFKELSDSLKTSLSIREPIINQLIIILRECNYYDNSEIINFVNKLQGFNNLSEWELNYMEGRSLFRAGVYNQAFNKISDAVRLQEIAYKKRDFKNDASLRDHNKRKADMYCDMASCKMQLFDEEGALKLLELSENTFKNERAIKLRYMIDGKANLEEETKSELDKIKQDAVKNVRESKEYKEVESFLNIGENMIFTEAKKMVTKWKKEYRRV